MTNKMMVIVALAMAELVVGRPQFNTFTVGSNTFPINSFDPVTNTFPASNNFRTSNNLRGSNNFPLSNSLSGRTTFTSSFPSSRFVSSSVHPSSSRTFISSSPSRTFVSSSSPSFVSSSSRSSPSRSFNTIPVASSSSSTFTFPRTIITSSSFPRVSSTFSSAPSSSVQESRSAKSIGGEGAGAGGLLAGLGGIFGGGDSPKDKLSGGGAGDGIGGLLSGLGGIFGGGGGSATGKSSGGASGSPLDGIGNALETASGILEGIKSTKQNFLTTSVGFTNRAQQIVSNPTLKSVFTKGSKTVGNLISTAPDLLDTANTFFKSTMCSIICPLLPEGRARDDCLNANCGELLDYDEIYSDYDPNLV